MQLYFLQSKVGDLEHIRIADQQVGRLDVPVHESRIMEICNALEHLMGELSYLLPAQGIHLALKSIVQGVRLVLQHQGEPRQIRIYVDNTQNLQLNRLLMYYLTS